MCDKICDLLKLNGFDSVEALENNLIDLQQKLSDAVAKKQNKLVDVFTYKLTKRQRLQSEVAGEF